MIQPRSISELFSDFQLTLTGDSISFDTLLEAFHERGFGIITLIFALPMALPVPMPPGVNIVLGTPLLFLTVQQIWGRRVVWFPLWLRHKSLSVRTLNGFLHGVIPFLKKLEVLTKPRLSFLTSPLAQKVTGVLGFLMTLMAIIPLPLTNTVPSFGIALMALGVLMRDGLAVAAGAIIGMGWTIMMLVVLILFGMEGINIVKDALRSLI
jgi:hypothetical protein